MTQSASLQERLLSGKYIAPAVAHEAAAELARLQGEVERREEANAQLTDALSGLLDWVSEGCPDGGAYSVVEARAALQGWRLLAAAPSSLPAKGAGEVEAADFHGFDDGDQSGTHVGSRHKDNRAKSASASAPAGGNPND